MRAGVAGLGRERVLALSAGMGCRRVSGVLNVLCSMPEWDMVGTLITRPVAMGNSWEASRPLNKDEQ